mmetsp:Transcript_9960/g.30388  ORF Transcript_9960/g.30388 Transcript_9960/m.30388 type:complete len:210 (+) Transcript_9960:316-945(+)
MSRVLGLGIVIFAGIIKVPQIFAILNNRSAAGISVNGYLIETLGYCYNLAFAYRMAYPLTAYGEYFLILLQNLIVIALMFYYNKKPNMGFGVVCLFSSLTIFMSSEQFPMSTLRYLTALNSVLAVASRLPQVVKNVRDGSVGTLSLLTCAGLAFGSLVRIYTTLQDVKEFTILSGFIVSCSFNMIILAQVIYYRHMKATSAEAEAKKKE